ncbi:hypothetical protein MYAM1_001941 [Malassezia yamatoensis]|uniref:Uncharacterized protein n=1 Tax=Malassezia yamatoensis TaxID=253288 RepID=A0AAJ5YSX8_9BASI|nr:hypothetical protein MYAM1_001941 [Malassezia yamatoensis]
MLCPTLAFQEARALSTDLATLYMGTKPALYVSEISDSDKKRVYYDEQVHAELTLTFPSVPSKLPAPNLAQNKSSFDIGDRDVPWLLHCFLSTLHISLLATRLNEPGRLLAYSWHGSQFPTEFVLSNDADNTDLGQDTRQRHSQQAPLLTAKGISYDSTAQVWRVTWRAAFVIPYPTTEPRANEVHLDVDFLLNLDLAQLITSVDAPTPQTPIHLAVTEVHPFLSSSDPYMIDVDLLAPFTEGVTIPDETPERRHKHIASKLALLPLSSLVPDTAKVNVVAPWNQSKILSQQIARAKEVELAAISSDADIALTTINKTGTQKPSLGAAERKSPTRPLSISTADTVRTQNSVRDIATAAGTAIVVLKRHIQTRINTDYLLHARIRTLSRVHSDIQQDSSFDHNRVMFLCVELESTSNTDVQVDDVRVTLGAGLDQDGRIQPVCSDSITPTIQSLQNPDSWPIRIGARAQRNLLYSIRIGDQHLRCSPVESAAKLAQWLPRREAFITVHGFPQAQGRKRQTSFSSRWNGAVDLFYLCTEFQTRLAADAAVADAIKCHPLPLLPPARSLVIGDDRKAASALNHSQLRNITSAVVKSSVEQPTTSSPSQDSLNARAPGENDTRRDYLDAARHRAKQAVPFATTTRPEVRTRPTELWSRPRSLDQVDMIQSAPDPGRLIASVSVIPKKKGKRGVPCFSSLLVKLTLMNVSSTPLEPIVAWSEVQSNHQRPSTTAMLVNFPEIRLPPIIPGSSGTATFLIDAIEKGRQSLGSLCVRDAHTDAVCTLHDLGSIAVV